MRVRPERRDRRRTAAAFAVLAVTLMLASAFVPTASGSDATEPWTEGTDTWRVELSSSNATGKDVLSVAMYKNGQSVDTTPIAQDTPLTTDHSSFRSNDGTNVGAWGFDENGYGPFNSFYAAFDPSQNNRMICHLDPNNLEYSLDGTISIRGHYYNVMWCLPTVYWGTRADGTLVLSDESSVDGVGEMQAYAHTIYVDGVPKVYPYIGIGVYEGTSSRDGAAGTRTLGSQMEYAVVDYRDADLHPVEIDETGTGASGSYAMVWNFYQWELYKYCALAVIGTWDTNSVVGRVGDNDSNFAAGGNEFGPYGGGKIGTGTGPAERRMKVFIEGPWAGYNDYVSGFATNSEITGEDGSKSYYFYASQALDPEYTSSEGALSLAAGQWEVVGTNFSPTERTYHKTPSTEARSWGIPTQIGSNRDCIGYGKLTDGVVGLDVGHTAGQYVFNGIQVSSMGTPLQVSSTSVPRLAMVFSEDILPTAVYDHSMLTDIVGQGADGVADLPSGKRISAGPAYDRLPTISGYKHVGWRIGDTTVGPDSEMVHSYVHTAMSVWEPQYVTYDHSALEARLISIGGSVEEMSGLPLSIPVHGHTAYNQLPDVGEFTHTGWLIDGVEYPATHTLVSQESHTAVSVWKGLPAVILDHSNLTSIIGSDAEGVSDLETSIAINGNSGYPKLPDTAGYRHIGWEIDGQIVGPTAGFVEQTTHEARSVWINVPDFRPVIPEEDEEPIEIEVIENGSEPWLGRNGKTILLIAVIAAIIGELAVLTYSRRH